MAQQICARFSNGFSVLMAAIGLVVVVLSAAGCSDSALRAANPVAPSQLAPDGASASASSGAHAASADVSRPFDEEDSDADSEDSEDSDEDSDEDSEDTDDRNRDDRNRGPEVEVEGLAGTLSGACPAVTFSVSGRTVRVGRDTAFRNGGCSDLRAGARVKVTGRRAADGSIDATRVELDNSVAMVDVDGEVRSVTGACPTLTLTVGTRVVKTTRDTTFRNGSCADVRTGMRVEIAARRGADGSMEAVRLELERPAAVEVELSGVITGASTGCPAGTFTLRVGAESVVIRTDATTRFRNGQCRNLRTTGRRLEVEGRRAADGSVDATRIEFRR